MYVGYYEEGDKCPKGCPGSVGYAKVEGCSCHINPPCSACVNNPLTCGSCGWEEDAPDYKDVMVAPGLAMREHKPRPLDKTKIDFRRKMHSSSSMLMEGVYPEGTTQAEVRKEVDGAFGGRFEMFGGGRFRFVAYTD